MKKKEFEKIGKALLPLLPGFVVHGDLVFKHPIRHILYGICFSRSIDPRDFYPHVFVQPLCVPGDVIALNCGWRIGGECHTWNADVTDLIPQLRKAVKREALPFLNRITSPSNAANAIDSLHQSKDPYTQQAIGYLRALAGEVEQACQALDQFIQLTEPTGYWHEEIARAKKLKTALLVNPAEARQQLEAWEAETLRNLGLEKFLE